MIRFKFSSITLAVTFLILPSILKAGIVVVNGLTHLYEVVPGEVYRGVIELQNTKNTEQAVKLYQRDYSFNFKGEAFYDEPGSISRSNTAWIDVSPTYLVMKPNEKLAVSYEIKVPHGLKLQGTYWSVIMVEGEAPIDTSNLKQGLTIQTQLRYAIQIATTVGNQGERNLSFYNVMPVLEDGKRQLAIDIENKGDFLFKPEVSVELYDQQGKLAGTFFAIRKKLYPNTSSRFMIGLDDIPPGTYQSLILADCGEEDVFGINMILELNHD